MGIISPFPKVRDSPKYSNVKGIIQMKVGYKVRLYIN